MIRRIEPEHRLAAAAEAGEASVELVLGEAEELGVEDLVSAAETVVAQDCVALVISAEHVHPERALVQRGRLAQSRIAGIRVGLALGREEDGPENPVEVR